MYRRYVIIGIVFFLLVGAYFVFFDKDKENKEYEKYYNKLMQKDNYSDNLDGVNLSIYESSEYVYTVILDGVSEKKNNIKVLIADSNASKQEVNYFPSFGIIDNKGYSLVLSGDETKKNEVKGISLSIDYDKKIEYLLIYFACDNEEQFIKVEIENYLK